MPKFVRSKERKPTRLKDCDYSENGEYFITICVSGMKECFGEINGGEMVLNEIGKIVKNQLLWLERQYPYVKLDEWVVMPNHLHAIIVIDDLCFSDDIIASNMVGNGRDRSLQEMKTKSLSGLVGAFKTTSSKKIHRTGFSSFRWQKSFYDHIIGTEEELDRIRDYIISNPGKWDEDRNNPKNMLNY